MRHAECWDGDSAHRSVVAPAIKKAAMMGFAPTASQRVDVVNDAIATLFESENIKKRFRDDTNQ